MEEKLINIIDRLAPLTLRKCVTTRSYNCKQNMSLVYKHRKLVARWKKNKNPTDRALANQIKKEIRVEVNKTRRDKIRMHIRPGNSKSLWDAVKIAKDEDASSIPPEMSLAGTTKKDEEVAKAFQIHFKKKVEDIIRSTKRQTQYITVKSYSMRRTQTS
jgi:hypothetical protein